MEYLSIKRAGCYKASCWLIHWMAHCWLILTTRPEWRMGRCILSTCCCGRQKNIWLNRGSTYFLFFLTAANWRLKWPSTPNNCDGWKACVWQLHLFFFFSREKKHLGQYNLSVMLSTFRLTSNSWLRMIAVNANSVNSGSILYCQYSLVLNPISKIYDD